MSHTGIAFIFDRIPQMGIPVKLNADSGGKPNGVPERR
jgi:hypothetical protein